MMTRVTEKLDGTGMPYDHAEMAPRRRRSGIHAIDTPELRAEIGRRLTDLRKNHRLEQQELALMMGLDRSALNKYERGRQLPPRDMEWHWDLAEALGLTYRQVYDALYKDTPLWKNIWQE